MRANSSTHYERAKSALTRYAYCYTGDALSGGLPGLRAMDEPEKGLESGLGCARCRLACPSPVLRYVKLMTAHGP